MNGIKIIPVCTIKKILIPLAASCALFTNTVFSEETTERKMQENPENTGEKIHNNAEKSGENMNNILDRAKESIKETAERAGEKIHHTAERANEKMSHTAERMGDKSHDVYDNNKERFTDFRDNRERFSRYDDDTKERPREAYDNTKEKVRDSYDDARDKVRDSYDNTKERVSDSYDNAKEKLNDTYDGTKEKFSNAYDKTKEKMGNLAEDTGEKTRSFAESAGTYVDDSALTAKVKVALAGDNAMKESDISVDTEKSVVTLTGFVISKEQEARAAELAKRISGVKSVTSQLHVQEAGSSSVMGYLGDAAITSKVKAKLLLEDSIPSREISVETKEGVVQLTGLVENQEQAKRAAECIRDISGIKRVQNDLKVQSH